MATTLAWSTHPQKLVTFLERACAPHGAFVAYGRHGTERERESEREREREELVTFLGQIPGKMWKYTHTSVTYDMVHDTHDADDTYSQDSWSHFGDKFLGRCGNTQIHLLHMIEMVQRVRKGERETERERERERAREKERERESVREARQARILGANAALA